MNQASVAFVDLAGFVALTDAHGATAAADLATRFVQLARQTTQPPARVVKPIGDAVLLTAPNTDSGLAAAVALINACLDEQDFPLARGGIDHGEVVEREGDVFGPAVNLAARLTSHAGAPQLLLTEPILPAARRADLPTEPLGPLRLRNLAQPVAAYAINLDAASQSVIDPVCRMRLDAGRAAGWLRHFDIEYWFCSRECLAAFANDPDAYIPAG